MATAKPAAGRLYVRKVVYLRVTFLQMNFASTPTSILNLTISFNGIPCVRKYCQLFTQKSIIDQYAIFALYSPPNCPFPFDDHHQNLVHHFRARLHSPPQTASQSIYGCGHCSHVRTDRWSRRKSRNISASLIE